MLIRRLSKLGFPSEVKKNIKMLTTYMKDVRIILVIEDYHFCKSEEIDKFINFLSKSKIKNLQIRILTRTLPDIFILTKHEIAKYFRQSKVRAIKDTIISKYKNSDITYIKKNIIFNL